MDDHMKHYRGEALRRRMILRQLADHPEPDAYIFSAIIDAFCGSVHRPDELAYRLGVMKEISLPVDIPKGQRLQLGRQLINRIRSVPLDKAASAMQVLFDPANDSPLRAFIMDAMQPEGGLGTIWSDIHKRIMPPGISRVKHGPAEYTLMLDRLTRLMDAYRDGMPDDAWRRLIAWPAHAGILYTGHVSQRGTYYGYDLSHALMQHGVPADKLTCELFFNHATAGVPYCAPATDKVSRTAMPRLAARRLAPYAARLIDECGLPPNTRGLAAYAALAGDAAPDIAKAAVAINGVL